MFEKCLGFVMRLKSFGNSNLGKLCVVLPPKIIYTSRRFPSNEMANVTVIERPIVAESSPFAVIVSLHAGMYFNGV